MEPALGLLEFDSIAAGIEAGDAMAKRAPIDVIRAGTVHPGKYLVLVAGAVADVEEALAAGRSIAGSSVVDGVFLPNVHPGVTAALTGVRLGGQGEALGVIETPTVAAIIDAADAGIKGASIRIIELRLADGLGGKGYVLFDGAVADVEAAVEIGVARIPGRQFASRVIARLHVEMRDNLEADARFRERVGDSVAQPEPPSARGARAEPPPARGAQPEPSKRSRPGAARRPPPRRSPKQA